MTGDQIQSIITSFNQDAEYFVWQGSNDMSDISENDRLQQYYESVLLPDVINGDEDYEKVLALMENAGYDWDQAEAEVGNDFKVFTDEEAETALEDYQESYIEDNILSQIPANLRSYFNSESFIEDNLTDRGTALSPYDGCENEETINGTTYYIYKQ